jgi:hypothetical protein
MSEAELVNAVSQTITLAYLPAQLWLGASTALILAVHFAARQIPAWLFGSIVLLYVLLSVSSVFELTQYSRMAEFYTDRLQELRAANHIAGPGEPPAWLMATDAFANYLMFVLGSLATVGYAWTTWRASR